MFTVIVPEPYRRRFAEPLRRRKTPMLCRVPVPHGASFYTLHVPYRGAFPWQSALDIVGKTPVLLPDGLHVPEGDPLRLFVPKRLPLLCAVQTVADALQKRDEKPVSLGVLDPCGALCGYTACLLPLSADVRIVTDVPERFQADVHAAMRTYGAALTVRRERSVLAGCSVIVCESADGIPGADAVYCLRQNSCRADTVCLSAFTMPDAYAALLPEGIDALTFASALYELCAVYPLAQCRFIL